MASKKPLTCHKCRKPYVDHCKECNHCPGSHRISCVNHPQNK